MFVYGPLYIELPELDTVLLRRRAIMHNTAATTHSIRTRPAIEMAMANVRCDTHSASSGFYIIWKRTFCYFIIEIHIDRFR